MGRKIGFRFYLVSHLTLYPSLSVPRQISASVRAVPANARLGRNKFSRDSTSQARPHNPQTVMLFHVARVTKNLEVRHEVICGISVSMVDEQPLRATASVAPRRIGFVRRDLVELRLLSSFPVGVIWSRLLVLL